MGCCCRSATRIRARRWGHRREIEVAHPAALHRGADCEPAGHECARLHGHQPHKTNGRVVDAAVRSCAESGGVTPCWELVPGQGTCTGHTMKNQRRPERPTGHQPGRHRLLRAVRPGRVRARTRLSLVGLRRGDEAAPEPGGDSKTLADGALAGREVASTKAIGVARALRLADPVPHVVAVTIRAGNEYRHGLGVALCRDVEHLSTLLLAEPRRPPAIQSLAREVRRHATDAHVATVGPCGANAVDDVPGLTSYLGIRRNVFVQISLSPSSRTPTAQCRRRVACCRSSCPSTRRTSRRRYPFRNSSPLVAPRRPTASIQGLLEKPVR